MVSTCSSSTSSIQVSSASDAPRCRQEARSRRRVSATSRDRSTCRAAQISAAGAAAARSQSQPLAAAASDPISGATQVGMCTPLVIEPIGTSRVSNPGHRPANIFLLTWPCRSETPLTRRASRMPMTAMLNTSGSPPG